MNRLTLITMFGIAVAFQGCAPGAAPQQQAERPHLSKCPTAEEISAYLTYQQQRVNAGIAASEQKKLEEELGLIMLQASKDCS